MDWEVNMGQEQPSKRIACFGFALFAGLAGQILFRSPLLAVIGFVAIIASTAEYFFPLKYRLDENGASVRLGISPTIIRWDEVKRLIPLPDGIRLSPLEKPSRLDNFRGVYLRFSGNEEAVLAKIRALWQSDEHSLD